MLFRSEVEAGAQRQMNEAHNVLTPEARISGYRQKLLDKVEGIVRESVRPLERIESIKILNVNGLGGQGGGTTEPNAALSDQVVNSALRFRAQAPLIDNLLHEIGMDASGIDRLAAGLTQTRPTSVPSNSEN